MSQSSQIVCDGCGRQKQEANHWWQVGLREVPGDWPGSMLVTPATRPAESWNIIGTQVYTVHDFCGHECALKFVSEQMGKHGEEAA